MSGAGPGAGPRGRAPRHGPHQFRPTPRGATRSGLGSAAKARRTLIKKFIRGLLAEPPNFELWQSFDLPNSFLWLVTLGEAASEGPNRYAAPGQPAPTGPIPAQPRDKIRFVNEVTSCWWIQKVVCDNMLEAGFAALLAGRQRDLDPSAASGSVRPGAAQISPPGPGAAQIPMSDAGPEAGGQDRTPLLQGLSPEKMKLSKN